MARHGSDRFYWQQFGWFFVFFMFFLYFAGMAIYRFRTESWFWLAWDTIFALLALYQMKRVLDKTPSI